MSQLWAKDFYINHFGYDLFRDNPQQTYPSPNDYCKVQIMNF